VSKTSPAATVSVQDASLSTPAADRPRTATLIGFAARGVPLIELDTARVPARSCVPLHLSDVGQQVVVVFESGRTDSPIVLGVIRPATAGVLIEGQHLTLTAYESVTLKCGAASITLTRDGKVAIRGATIVSQADGSHRIRGGSVELN
jgi:hypothetical protein